jgi:predicted alpha/beta-hydrolase family hydrolase
MEQTALLLAEQGIATLRFNFPYMEKGKRVPDPKPVCTAAISAAAEKATRLCPGLPLFASGKSFGGRMTSTAASEGLIQNIKGIVFFGFPLHLRRRRGPPKATCPEKPSIERVQTTSNIPMLCPFPGFGDLSLASLELLKPVSKKTKLKFGH